MLAIIF